MQIMYRGNSLEDESHFFFNCKSNKDKRETFQETYNTLNTMEQ